MSDYTDLVKSEAERFFKEDYPRFLEDEGEFGSKSDGKNLLRWIDHHGSLASHVQAIGENWGLKEHNWVQANTRSKSPPGGDAANRAFASFLQDVRHAIKKRAKK